jgi:hypothetical protein
MHSLTKARKKKKKKSAKEGGPLVLKNIMIANVAVTLRTAN